MILATIAPRYCHTVYKEYIRSYARNEISACRINEEKSIKFICGQITGWIHIKLNSTDAHHFCRNCNNMRGYNLLRISTIYIPLCHRCVAFYHNVTINNTLCHYSYIFWCLKQYTINDIAHSILHQIARPTPAGHK